MKIEKSDYDISLDPIDVSENNGQDETQVLLEEVRRYAASYQSAWQDNYDRSAFDRKMVAGIQWPEEIRLERQEDGRPMLTINKLPTFISQVAGDALKNKISVNLKPIEGNQSGSPETPISNAAGDKDYSRAQVIEGMIKNIEYISDAESHYDRQFNLTLSGGIGWLRVYTERNPTDPFVLDLKIGGIKRPSSVFIDPDCKEPDYSDMKRAYIFNKIHKNEFKKRWPDATIGGLETKDMEDWWYDDEYYGVAEYFTREYCSKRVYKMSDGQVWDSLNFGDDKEKIKQFEKNGGTESLEIVSMLDIPCYKVVWRLVTAFDVLEGPIDFPTSTIPLVPVLGRERITDDAIFYESLIRHAIDSQLEYNYWRTAATEMVALQPKQPWIGPAEVFENHKAQWNNANRKNYAYLPYTEVPSGARPERQMMHGQAIGEMAQAMQASDDMKATIGLFDASMGARSNETSGIAIAERKKEGETGTYEFIDNRNKAVKRIYKLLLEAMPKIYDTPRQMRIFGNNGDEDWIKINDSVEVDGEVFLLNDLNMSRYDIVVETGPAYATQREEAMTMLLEFIRVVPDAGPAAMDMLAEMADFPGASDLAARLRRQIPTDLLDQADRVKRIQEMESMPQPPVPPELQIEQQIEAAKQAQEEAKVQQRQLDLEETKAVIRQKELELQIQQARNQEKAIIAESEGSDNVRDLVADAIAEVLASLGGEMPQEQMSAPGQQMAMPEQQMIAPDAQAPVIPGMGV